MAQHYVYADPDRDTLKQGDVLDRTKELTAILQEYHPHYGAHKDYRYFLVLTQTCDLFRRGGELPKARYITLAAVRPVEDALRQEAVRLQSDWQREVGVIGSEGKNKLMLFMERLIDNNEPGYFYLHEDQSLGLAGNNCAFLALSVALRICHYDVCLAAKLAQLTDPFQAKLGWLVGNMYSRVGTTEWNQEVSDKKVADQAREEIDRTFLTIDDRKISNGLRKLRERGDLEARSPKEILNFVRSIRVVPKSKQFADRAVQTLCESDLADLIRDRVIGALLNDAELCRGLEELCAKARPQTELDLRVEILDLVRDRCKAILTRKNIPGYEKLCRQVVARIQQDARISRILNAP